MSSFNCITDIEGILVGQVSDLNNMTGCTVILCPEGATCGVDVRGGAPGSRESCLLNPMMANNAVHAIFLSGGSSFGLSVGDGVMKYLEERNIGFDTNYGKVPIVPGSILFDLCLGSSAVRPDKDMGYLACVNAKKGKIEEGNRGAGTGATVGKALGFENSMKGGIGSASITLDNGIVVGAIVAVNAFGDIRDSKTKTIIAGPLKDNKPQDTLKIMMEQQDMTYSFHKGNTTIAVVATNAKLTKSECTKVAQMASNGLINTIYPYGTTLDGDTIYVMSNGDCTCDINLLGILAGEALATAAKNGIQNAETVKGIKSYKDISANKK